MSDIKTFVSKFPKEFNEFVNIFKSFKINNNTQEISRETVISLVENPYLKEFIKSLTEDELIELLRMLGLKLKKKVNTKTVNNKKTKLSILNSIVQKMLLSGLKEEYRKQTFDLLAKMPTDELERFDKFEKFEKSFIDEIIGVLEIKENIVDEFDITNNKIDNKITKETGESTDIVSQIKNRFSFGNETGSVADLKHIHNNEKQNSLYQS